MKKLSNVLISMILIAIFSFNTIAAGWTNIDGFWYYLDEQGNPVINVFRKSGDYWFYMGEDGRMVKDTWVEHKGNWYYMNSDGAMLASCLTPDGYLLDSEGKWDGKESIYMAQTNTNIRKQGSSEAYALEPERRSVENLPFTTSILDNSVHRASYQTILLRNIGVAPIIVYSAFSRNISDYGWEAFTYLKYCPENKYPHTVKANSVLINPNEAMYLEFNNINDEVRLFGQDVAINFIYEYDNIGYFARINTSDDNLIVGLYLDDFKDVEKYADIDLFRNDVWNEDIRSALNLY